MGLLHKDLTSVIIQAYYDVYNEMGYGFLEKVYGNAFVIHLRKMGLHVVQQKSIEVFYGGELVGNYFADLMVENLIIIELKAAVSIKDEHKAQLRNYLKATHAEVGLLFNFGKKPEFSREIFENEFK